eukprot:PhM_4_TR7401/c0_g1_i1/m.43516
MDHRLTLLRENVEDHAAVTIQCWWRRMCVLLHWRVDHESRLCEVDVLHEDTAAGVVQGLFRAHLERRRDARRRLLRCVSDDRCRDLDELFGSNHHRALVILQSVFRGIIARRCVRRIRTERQQQRATLKLIESILYN